MIAAAASNLAGWLFRLQLEINGQPELGDIYAKGIGTVIDVLQPESHFSQVGDDGHIQGQGLGHAKIPFAAVIRAAVIRAEFMIGPEQLESAESADDRQGGLSLAVQIEYAARWRGQELIGHAIEFVQGLQRRPEHRPVTGWL